MMAQASTASAPFGC